ncbi:MAG: hypothetical protein HDT48_04200 [Ruminococcaceae bacterium]|nr:hypothetical protein [Oscillospiraceae bacterium]
MKSGGAAGVSPPKRVSVSNFRRRRKFGSAPAVGQPMKKEQLDRIGRHSLIGRANEIIHCTNLWERYTNNAN